MIKLKPIAPLAAAILLTLPNLVIAQENEAEGEVPFEVITVTSQKREQDIMDVPISVTAVSGELIAKGSIDNLSSLSDMIPNLNINEGHIDSNIQMRGIYTGNNKGFEQSVAMYSDGIYFGRSQLIRLPLVDLERVEVLRGPQPTLFGKNAIAGAVSVWSARPTDEFEASIALSYEFEHKEPQFVGILSGPLSEDVNARLVVSSRQLEGWAFNQQLERMEPDIEETFVRGTIEWAASEKLTVRLKAETSEFNKEGWPMEINNARGAFGVVYSENGPFGNMYVETDADFRVETNRSNSLNDVTNLVLNFDYKMGDHTINAITGYVDYDTTEMLDVDYTRLDILDGTNQSESYSQFSQEIRLTSPGGENVDYIAGVYFQTGDLRVTDEVKFGTALLQLPPSTGYLALTDSYTDRLYKQENTLWSVFAQADINFTDDLTLTVGARYNQEDKDASRSLAFVTGPNNLGVVLASPHPAYPDLLHFVYAALNMWPHEIEGNRDEDSFNPLVNLQYQLSEDTMTYISYVKGSKAGGFDVRGNSYEGLPVLGRAGTWEFEDETATSIEAGIKMGFDRAQLNLAVFSTDYEDLQSNQFDGVLSFLVTNAAEATTQGVELDGRVMINDNLTVYGSAAYLDFEFTDFELGQCYFGRDPDPATGYCSHTGSRAPNTPEWQGNLGFDFGFELSDTLWLDANLNVSYSDEYFTQSNLDPFNKQDSFTTVDLIIGLSSSDGTWRVSLIGGNLTDERTMDASGQVPLSTNLTGGAGIAYDSIWARPRNYALKFEYQFY